MNELKLGDLVQLVDSKKRRYTMVLTDGKEFQNHRGNIRHIDLVGLSEGSMTETSNGQRFQVYKPTLSEFVTEMPRGAQIIYPKDLGAIIMFADLAPGDQVFESGVGSGALSIAMLRMGVNITAVEIREEFANRAKSNVESFLGAPALERYTVHDGSAYDKLPETVVDKVVLDLPEPWEAIAGATKILRPGGIFVSYSPSIIQVSKVAESLYSNGYIDITTTEVIHRDWHVVGDAVRPEHRMVGHTGFLVRGRISSAGSET